MTKKPVKATAAGKKYFRAVDLMLAAVEYTRKGMPVRAAKALADAAQDEQVDDALQQLNQDQQSYQDEQTDSMDFEQQQAKTSRVLANLIKASHKRTPVVAEADDEDEDLEDEDMEEDEEDEQEETAEVGDDEDDLSLSLDSDQEDEDEDGDLPVQAAVSSRLNRAARNKARRAA